MHHLPPQQKARQMAVQFSSTTGWTAQPKVTTTKSSATSTTSAKPTVLPQQMRLFHHSHSHCSRHKLHHRDDCHHKATEHFPRQDTATRVSHQPNCCKDTPMHLTQSEQTRRVHSTHFYKWEYHHTFCRSPPKMSDYISQLHRDAKIQWCLEALKQPQQPEFKVPLPPGPSMDVEPIVLTTAQTSTITALLLPITKPPTSTSLTTTTATIPPIPKLKISMCPVLRAAPAAGTALQFKPQLLSESITLPNYVHFHTTDLPHSITLATPGYSPQIDARVDSFSPRTLHEMVLINFFSCIRVRITMAPYILVQQTPRSHCINISALISVLITKSLTRPFSQTSPPSSCDGSPPFGLRNLAWSTPFQTAHFGLFLYKACGLDNVSCLIQAYNTPVSLIDCWMAYLQYSPFPQPLKITNIHRIYLQYHSKTDCLVPLLHRHDFSARWNLLWL
uniref:Uncharacterized protein n=1 Tax=Romanomermis culicivorax TaxID=13658 RepID=A0A915L671_ROMCU